MESTLNPNPAPVMCKFESTNSKGKSNLVLGLVSVVVVLVGIGTGYLLSGFGGSSTSPIGENSDEIVASNKEAGIADESKFSTTTDGVLEEGGIGGEGTHHLVRGVGPSQYAYLTSSVVDLSKFEGKKVQIWGETMSGKKAGWLIDVGKIKEVE